jgi:Ca2+-binding RTX toxin-like protein
MNRPQTKTRTRLDVETLEARENPAMFFSVPGEVDVIATEAGGCNVTVTQPNTWDDITVKDNLTGVTQTFLGTGFGLTKVVFHGGTGNDRFDASNIWSPVTADGGAGDDTLHGGNADDHLYGGAGNDWLFSGQGNNSLYGGSGHNVLYAGDGNDFLDGGGPTGNLVNPGGGQNFLAYTPVLNGTTPDDVMQRRTPTCWIDSALAAAAKAGINLASRISYLGNGLYSVQLKNPNGAPTSQLVSLDGGKLDFEPALHGNESWVILYQRALMQQLGKDWHTLSGYSGGWPDQVMPFLTGRAAYSRGESWGSGGHFDKTKDHEMQNIQFLLNSGSLVCACTNQGDFGTFNVLGSVSTPMLAGGHCYAVDSIDMAQATITLRNPWGSDIGDGKDATVPSGNPSDGLVTIAFDEFYNSMWSYSFS